MSQFGESMDVRATRGAALLDEVRPGWRAEIDLDALEMDAPWACVLGQLFGSFDSGATELGLDSYGTEVREHGFDLFIDEYHSEIPNVVFFEELNSAWVRRITFE